MIEAWREMKLVYRPDEISESGTHSRWFLQGPVSKTILFGPVETASCIIQNTFASMSKLNGLYVPHDKIPAENCHCGFYALKHKPNWYPRNKKMLGGNGKWSVPHAGGYLVGMMIARVKVGLFGRIIEHEHGYRAEKIIVQEIGLCPFGRHFARKFIGDLADLYECEVNMEP